MKLRLCHSLVRLNLYSTLRISISVIFFIFVSCNSGSQNISLTAYNIDSAGILNNNGIYYKNGQLLTAYIFSLYSKGDTVFSKQIINGKENGIYKKWYANNQLEEVKDFTDGKKEGIANGYWSNGEKKFSYNYYNDMFEGEQLQWFSNGKLYIKSNFKNGREQGLQRVWDNAGKLLINYEALNGRNYGNIGKKNCRSLWKNDSFIVAK